MAFRPIWSWCLTTAIVVVLVWSSGGCGNSTSSEKLYPVTGKVTYKGEPLTTGTVILVADLFKGNNTQHEPRGPIDKQGSFEVSTAGKPGAPPVGTGSPSSPRKLPTRASFMR